MSCEHMDMAASEAKHLDFQVKGAINYRLCFCITYKLRHYFNINIEFSFHHLHWVLTNVIFMYLLLLCFCLYKRTLSRLSLPFVVWSQSIHLVLSWFSPSMSFHSHNFYPLSSGFIPSIYKLSLPFWHKMVLSLLSDSSHKKKAHFKK